MVSIAHAVTGAFIASRLPQPSIYVPLCLASHFLLDYVHHYDVGVAMKKYHFNKKQIVFWEALDLIGAVALVAIFFQQTPGHFSPNIWTGAFTGILPDLIEASNFFFHRPMNIFRPFYYFHEHYHHSTQVFWWGVVPQIILVSIIALLVTFS